MRQTLTIPDDGTTSQDIENVRDSKRKTQTWAEWTTPLSRPRRSPPRPFHISMCTCPPPSSEFIPCHGLWLARWASLRIFVLAPMSGIAIPLLFSGFSPYLFESRRNADSVKAPQTVVYQLDLRFCANMPLGFASGRFMCYPRSPFIMGQSQPHSRA